MKLLPFLLTVAYPVLAHWAVVSRSVAVTVASLAVLVVLTLLPRLVARSVLAWCLLPLAVGCLLLLARADAAWLPLYATPVFISVFAAWVFGHTLAAGQVPLIERLVRLLREPDDISEEVARYARKVTVAWTVFLSCLSVFNLTLALLATPDGVLLMMGVRPPVIVSTQVWSLFANFLNYVIAGVFFLAEYFYRRRRFPEQPYRNLFDFVRRAGRVGHRAMGEWRS